MEEYRIEVSHPSSLVGSPLGAMPSAETLEVVPLPTGGAAARKDPVERGKEPMNSQRPAAKLGANSEKSVPEDSKSDPFVLGEGLPILPAKLTAKILRGEFVEMHELLQDNIALEKKVADELTTLNQGTKQSKKRELTEDVHGLLSWVECFNLFSSVLLSKYPNLHKALTAYQSTIVREARRFGFRGWLQYDQLFRQHAAKDPETAAWGSLNSALYAISFLSRQRGDTLTCASCMSSDHATGQCALARREDPYFAKRRPLLQRPLNPKRGIGSNSKTCYSWNDGRCARGAGACNFRHCCLRCGDDHKMVDCPHKASSSCREKAI